jgi:micrococcal nuclease
MLSKKYSFLAFSSAIITGILLTSNVSASFNNYFNNFTSSFFSYQAKQTQNSTVKSNKVNEVSSKNIKSWVEISGPYKVTKVSDWDTIKVDIDGKTETIRILSLDTPEKFTTRTGEEECYGKEASKIANDILYGKKVYLEKDLSQDSKDKYGRLLRHVILENGDLFQQKMIAEWYGFNYVYKKPSFYNEVLEKAQKEAQKNNKWVWSKCEGKRLPISKMNKN